MTNYAELIAEAEKRAELAEAMTLLVDDQQHSFDLADDAKCFRRLAAAVRELAPPEGCVWSECRDHVGNRAVLEAPGLWHFFPNEAVTIFGPFPTASAAMAALDGEKQMTDAITMMAGDLTRDEAISLVQSGWWKTMPSDVVFRAQINQPRLCMDFSAFHEAAEEALGRSVWTHEFADKESLIAELENRIPKPDMTDIVDKLIDRVGPDRVIVVKP